MTAEVAIFCRWTATLAVNAGWLRSRHWGRAARWGRACGHLGQVQVGQLPWIGQLTPLQPPLPG